MVAAEGGGYRRAGHGTRLGSPVTQRDGGYAWVVLFSGFMLNVFTAGNFAILGIFLVEFLHHFQVTKATVTWIGALQMCVGNFAGLGLGPLIRRYGPRPVAMGGGLMITCGFLVSGIWPSLIVIYVFYGAVTSVGFLAIHMSGMVAVQQYFVKRRALANGIFMTGFSVGTFALPPLVRIIIDTYSWAGALVIVAGIMMHSVFFATLLRPIERANQDMLSNPVDVPEQTNNRDEDKYSTSYSFWRTYSPFALFLVGSLLIQMGHMSVYTYTPLRCDAIGVSKQDTSFLLAIMGLTGLFARPTFGWLGDRKLVNKTIMFGLCGVVVGVITLASTQLLDFPRLAAMAALFGTINAGYIAVQGAVLVDTAGITRIEVATGVFMANLGLANFLLLMSSGYILDNTGDANAPFLIFGTAEIFGAILVLCVPLLRKRLQQGFQYGGTIPLSVDISVYEGPRDEATPRRIYNKTSQDTESTIFMTSPSRSMSRASLRSRSESVCDTDFRSADESNTVLVRHEC